MIFLNVFSSDTCIIIFHKKTYFGVLNLPSSLVITLTWLVNGVDTNQQIPIDASCEMRKPQICDFAPFFHLFRPLDWKQWI